MMAATLMRGGVAREPGKGIGTEISACTLSAELVPEGSAVIDKDASPWISTTLAEDATPTATEFSHRRQ